VIQRSILASGTDIGSAPSRSNWPWNSRTSKRGPGDCSARAHRADGRLAYLVAERHRVQRPALGVGDVAVEAAETRRVGQLLLDRDSEVMARRRFMQ
jgi:hypothetical protein